MTNSPKQKLSNFNKNSFVSRLFVSGLLLMSSSAFAQKGFEFGIRYMVTASALVNKSDNDAGSEIDPARTVSYMSGGIAVIYNFNKHMGLEMDILHSRQGQSYTGNNMLSANSAAYNREIAIQASLNDGITTGKYKAKAELNCMKIPILFNLSSNRAKRMYYTLSAGPQINILQSAVYELDGEDVMLPGTNIEPTDAYRRVTIDGVLSLGAGFNLSKHFALMAQARFDYGFQDVEKKGVTYSYMGGPDQKYYGNGRSSTHNATAALMIGLNYKLHK